MAKSFPKAKRPQKQVAIMAYFLLLRLVVLTAEEQSMMTFLDIRDQHTIGMLCTQPCSILGIQVQPFQNLRSFHYFSAVQRVQPSPDWFPFGRYWLATERRVLAGVFRSILVLLLYSLLHRRHRKVQICYWSAFFLFLFSSPRIRKQKQDQKAPPYRLTRRLLKTWEGTKCEKKKDLKKSKKNRVISFFSLEESESTN